MRHHAIGASAQHFLIFPIKSVEKWQAPLENVRKSGRMVSKKVWKSGKNCAKIVRKSGKQHHNTLIFQAKRVS
jgi:hypothetical protein